MKVVVIGAGIVGCSVAYALARAGADVTVLEKNRVGSGTSGTSFAWTNANRKPPRAYHDLNVAGMKLWIELKEEFGGADWFRVTGSIEWVKSDADRQAQRERVERLHSWGYAAEWIDLKTLAELEPDVSLARVGDAQIAYFPDEGLVDAVSCATAMIGRAVRQQGAKLLIGSEVTSLDVSGGKVTGAITAKGDRVEADMFVNCTGWEINNLVSDPPELHIPMAPTIGLLMYTPPAPAIITRPLHDPQVNIRPDGAGRLMLRKNEADEEAAHDEQVGPSSEIVQQSMDLAAGVIPALSGMKVEATRRTVRSIPEDDVAVIGTLPGADNYYLCVTHSGVTLSPVLGKVVAEDILESEASIDLAPFRPTRFLQQGAPSLAAG